jgi:histidine triad (HIT) family protein
MATIFTMIINGEIPCHKVAEDDDFFAFMDIRPINRGHVLVVPKVEVDRMFDLPNELLSKIMLFAKPIADAQEETVDCERVGIVVAGLEVPHAHLHLIPFNDGSELTFARASDADMDDLANIAEALRKKLA